jgi:hypothetical protein
MDGFEGLGEHERAGLDELERYLSTALILTWGEAVLEGGHPEKHRMVLAGGVQVMAKPGFDQFEGVIRSEAAGWQIARNLGFPGLVAGTTPARARGRPGIRVPTANRTRPRPWQKATACSGHIRDTSAHPQERAIEKPRFTGLSQSRRPDSNRGPLHYE